MIAINKEQQIAGTLQIINNIIGVIALIPAYLIWIFTFLCLLDLNQDLFYLSCSSAFLIVFYGYTIWSPRIYLLENYNQNTSFNYWLIVLITNLLAGFLFISMSCWMVAIVPAIPFLFALYGLVVHLKLNSKK